MDKKSSNPISFDSTHTEFAKELGLKEAISIAVGAMIGGGIFSVLGRLAGLAGPSAVLSFFLGGVIVFLTANSYYKLVSKYPSAGGEFTILRQGLDNPLIGNVVGMMLWLGYSVTIALYAFTFGLYTSEFLHSVTHLHFFEVDNPDLVTGRKVLAAFSIFLFMAINLKGVKESGTVQNFIVAFKLAVLLFIGALGIWLFNPDAYTPFTSSADPLNLFEQDIFGGFSGIVIGSAVIFVSYEGFQVIANTVEELENPARDVKIGMYISVVTVAITYMVVTVATFSLVDDTNNISEAALIQAVEFLGPWAVLLITLGAAASTTSAINATLLGSSRLAYVMSDYKAFPSRIAVISKKTKVPYMAVIVTSLISWFFTFFGNAEQIAEVGSIIFLGIFLAINLATIKILKDDSNYIAKIASGLIVIYIMLVFAYFFTHLEESELALIVLGAFLAISIGYMLFVRYMGWDKDIDESKYILDPLGRDLIKEFKGVPKERISDFAATGIPTDDFFIGLERMLVPVSGGKFETLHWSVSAQIARRYRVKATLLYIGSDTKKLDNVTRVFDQYMADYDVIIKNGNGMSYVKPSNTKVAQIIIEEYSKGDYQLVTLGSRRTKGIINRTFRHSVSKMVVDEVDSAVLQMHPPKYGQRRYEVDNVFLLLDGTERDFYLARWAKLITSVGGRSFAYPYHIVTIPQTISLEDAAEFPELRRSASEFASYATDMCRQLALDADPTLLYGHNFVKSLEQATEKHEPDVVLIGHTKDEGLWNRIRTRLAYRIMRRLRAGVIVYHEAEDKVR